MKGEGGNDWVVLNPSRPGTGTGTIGALGGDPREQGDSFGNGGGNRRNADQDAFTDEDEDEDEDEGARPNRRSRVTRLLQAGVGRERVHLRLKANSSLASRVTASSKGHRERV